MKESIGARVGRIISGSFNAIVDAVESAAPEVVMKEAIREVESAIEDVKAEYGKVIAQKHMATKSLAAENEKLEDMNEKAQFAVDEGKDDLAKAALKKVMQAESQIPILEKTIAGCLEQEKELESYIKALQGKKEEMEEEIENFKKSVEAGKEQSLAPGEDTVSGGAKAANKVSKASGVFNRVLKNAGMDKKAGDLSSVDESKVKELEALQQSNRLDERLAALKAKKK